MSEQAIFPRLCPSYILAFQFSSWYPLFEKHTIRSTIIRPLSSEFQDYLNADGIFVPQGSENAPAITELSDDEGDEDDEDGEETKTYTFPELDSQIRSAVQEYDAVFPKLNFSSPKDASWLLPASSPLKCTSPADVYMLLKSSDFITHDLDPSNVFEGCDAVSSGNDSQKPKYNLELVLRKWYPVDRARELRCFVRNDVLIGITQRDNNYYEFWNDSNTQKKVVQSVKSFWESTIKPRWHSEPNYVFDFLLTRDLSRGHILDFNPYAPKTDSLLFTYPELQEIADANGAPQLRVIDSARHPAAASNVPAHQHNMIPFEAVNLSSGRDIEEFADTWKDSLKESMKPESDE
ncbi:D123-domain-containing protein [Panaeolus papilionaceus]|nr:D123-domain-containing protein [Panaeolus papilionaceus]